MYYLKLSVQYYTLGLHYLLYDSIKVWPSIVSLLTKYLDARYQPTSTSVHINEKKRLCASKKRHYYTPSLKGVVQNEYPPLPLSTPLQHNPPNNSTTTMQVFHYKTLLEGGTCRWNSNNVGFGSPSNRQFITCTVLLHIMPASLASPLTSCFRFKIVLLFPVSIYFAKNWDKNRPSCRIFLRIRG